MIYNFQTVQFSHLLIMYDISEIIANLSESANIFSPQCPLAEIFELVYQTLPMSDALNYRLV